MDSVLLVSMPFASLQIPPLGVGQLVSAGRRDGLAVEGLALSFRFAETVGVGFYSWIAERIRPESLIGEWVFSRAAFDGSPGHHFDSSFAERFLSSPDIANICRTTGRGISYFRRKFETLPTLADRFLEEASRTIVARRPAIVGCSSSFQQHTASLALLRRIKESHPDTVTILGGANCEAESGLVTLKNCVWLDFVFSGEADSIFPGFCRQVLRDGRDVPPEELPEGVFSRSLLAGARQQGIDLSPELAATAIEADLAGIPDPEFDWYFEGLQSLKTPLPLSPMLSMETSRGCWKGAHRPCTFCGLNGKRIGYRSKSAERVLQELERLSDRYGTTEFVMTDTMLNMGFFKTVLPELRARAAPYRLMFETPSNLSEEQVRLLAQAGVHTIQPGIESLNDALLELMDKGNSTISSIALLKYALENGISVWWNLLSGIPGDRAEYYEGMVEILPLLHHLDPPSSLVELRFDRFSRYHTSPERYRLRLTPRPEYFDVFPFRPPDMEQFAQFFHDRSETGTDEYRTVAIHGLSRSIDDWRDHHYQPASTSRPQLQLIERTDASEILDTRSCAVRREHILTGSAHRIYRLCRQPVSCKELQGTGGDTGTLERLVADRLLLDIGGYCLALAAYPTSRVEAE
jgi:ribosomal peptide maturation radical SAM protein 1